MRISALAEASGVSIDTIRYYEKQGLLPTPRRTPGGLRDYGPDTIRQLAAIRRAKALGFSLAEIRELLTLGTEAAADAEAVRQRASERLAETEAELVELMRQRDELAALVEACAGGHTTRSECPILIDLWGTRQSSGLG